MEMESQLLLACFTHKVPKLTFFHIRNDGGSANNQTPDAHQFVHV